MAADVFFVAGRVGGRGIADLIRRPRGADGQSRGPFRGPGEHAAAGLRVAVSPAILRPPLDAWLGDGAGGLPCRGADLFHAAGSAVLSDLERGGRGKGIEPVVHECAATQGADANSPGTAGFEIRLFGLLENHSGIAPGKPYADLV